MSERRQNVRVRPAPGVPITVLATLQGERQPLQVLDVSVGGIGLLRGTALAEVKVGEELKLELSLGKAPFEISVSVRHCGPFEHSACGVQFLEMSEENTTAIRRYVADMLERGMIV